MPVLAYCIAEAEKNFAIPSGGVRGMPVTKLIAGQVQCFFSRFEHGGLEQKASVRDAALDFHRTVQELFRQAAVLPFRFPTILADDGELLAYLSKQGSEFAEGLLRLRDAVQMEIRIEERSPVRSPASSGAEYLREKQAAHARVRETAAQFQQASEPWTKEWQEREVSGGVRCYVLLLREHIEQFSARMKTVALPPHHSARVSGPWPATEFFKVKE